MRAKYILLAVFVALILLGAGVSTVWLAKSWLWREVNRHTLAGTQCAIVASALRERLKGLEEIDDRAVAAALADMATTEGEHYSAFPSEGTLLDPWGNPLSVTVNRAADDYVICVRSAGPDGIMASGDDYVWDKTRWPVRKDMGEPTSSP